MSFHVFFRFGVFGPMGATLLSVEGSQSLAIRALLLSGLASFWFTPLFELEAIIGLGFVGILTC